MAIINISEATNLDVLSFEVRDRVSESATHIHRAEWRHVFGYQLITQADPIVILQPNTTSTIHHCAITVTGKHSHDKFIIANFKIEQATSNKLLNSCALESTKPPTLSRDGN